VQCPSTALPTRDLAKSGTDPAQATLVEIFADAVVDGAATGFALGHLKPSGKPLLWIQDRLTRREAGRPCLAGLPAGLDIIHVDVRKATDVLWSMEEGLRCADLWQRHDSRAPGQALWQADLFRSRWRMPGQWVVHHDVATGLQFQHPSSTQAAAQQVRQA